MRPADRFGQVIDSAHFGSSAALNGAVKYTNGGANGMAVAQPVEGDDVVYVFPWKMLPECEVRGSRQLVIWLAGPLAGGGCRWGGPPPLPGVQTQQAGRPRARR